MYICIYIYICKSCVYYTYFMYPCILSHSLAYFYTIAMLSFKKKNSLIILMLLHFINLFPLWLTLSVPLIYPKVIRSIKLYKSFMVHHLPAVDFYVCCEQRVQSLIVLWINNYLCTIYWKSIFLFSLQFFFFFIAEGLSDFHWKAKKEKSIEMGERNLLSSGYSTVASWCLRNQRVRTDLTWLSV